MNELKAGDKVRVRKDLEVGKYYGYVPFVEDMANLRGRIVTISEELFRPRRYCICESVYTFTETMFKKIEDEWVDDEDKDDEESSSSSSFEELEPIPKKRVYVINVSDDDDGIGLNISSAPEDGFVNTITFSGIDPYKLLYGRKNKKFIKRHIKRSIKALLQGFMNYRL